MLTTTGSTMVILVSATRERGAGEAQSTNRAIASRDGTHGRGRPPISPLVRSRRTARLGAAARSSTFAVLRARSSCAGESKPRPDGGS
jgi:hypothetical protein